MVDLSHIMSRKASEIEPPKALPTGLYLAQVEKVGDVREVGANKTPALDITLRLTQAIDVEVPGDVEFPRSVRHTLWLSEQSLFRTREFLESTLRIEAGNKTLGEMIQEMPNRMCRVEVIEKSYTPKGSDTPQMINEVGKTFALD